MFSQHTHFSSKPFSFVLVNDSGLSALWSLVITVVCELNILPPFISPFHNFSIYINKCYEKKVTIELYFSNKYLVKYNKYIYASEWGITKRIFLSANFYFLAFSLTCFQHVKKKGDDEGHMYWVCFVNFLGGMVVYFYFIFVIYFLEVLVKNS